MDLANVPLSDIISTIKPHVFSVENYNRQLLYFQNYLNNRKITSDAFFKECKENYEKETTHQLFLLYSGDFMLMKKEDYISVKGYNELTTWSHIDVILLCNCDRLKYHQIVLFPPDVEMYHQWHTHYNYNNKETNLGYWCSQPNPNNENWGFRLFSLNETIIYPL